MDNLSLFIKEVETYLEDNNPNFELLLDYLNKVVEKLEDKTCDLTNSVSLYVLGVKLGEKLRNILNTNQELVEKCMKELSQGEIKNTLEIDDLEF